MKSKTKANQMNTESSKGIIIGGICTIILLLGIFLGFGLVQLSFIGPHEATKTEFTPVSYSDYVTILLTAITVILTVLGLFIAIVAVFSFTFLRSLVSTQAVSKTEEIMDGAFREGGTIHTAVLEKLNSDKVFQEQVVLALTRTYIESTGNDLGQGEDND